MNRYDDAMGELAAWKMMLAELRVHIHDELVIDDICTTVAMWGAVAIMHSRLHQSDEDAREYLADRHEQYRDRHALDE